MSLSEQVDKLIASGNHQQAGILLENSLHSARKSGNKAEELRVLNEQLGYYRSTGQKDKSLETCDKVLACLQYFPGHGDEDYATALLNVATSYRAAGQSGKALELYVMVEEIYSDVLTPNDTRYAALYNNAALACLETHSQDRAKFYLTSAVRILENSGPQYTGELATALTNLALIAMGAGQYDSSEELLNRALDLFGRIGNNPHKSAALAALANLYCLKKNYAESLPLYQAALKEIEFYYGRNGDYSITSRNYSAASAAASAEKKTGGEKI